MAVALALPLFGVAFLRADSEDWSLHVPLPLLGLMAVGGLGLVMFLVRDPRRPRPLVPASHRPALVVLYVFFMWHVWSLLLSSHFHASRKEVVKLAISVVGFWCTLAFFPRDRRFLGRFFVVSLWSSMLLVGFMIYMYAFVFHSVYLGSDLEEEAKFGRAQLAWYMSMLFPYAFFYFWKARAKLRAVLPTMVLLIGLLYDQTRGAWISVAVGFIFAVVTTWRVSKREAMRLAAVTAGGTTLMIAAALWVLAQYVDLTEFATRVVSIYDPGDVPQLHSYEVRWRVISQAFEGFLRSPVIGVGVGNTREFVERLTHNDVMTVLLELGLVGIVLFAAVILLVGRASRIFDRQLPEGTDWLVLATQAGYVNWIMSMMFINVYTSAQFWLFPALFMVAGSLPPASEPFRERARRRARFLAVAAARGRA